MKSRISFFIIIIIAGIGCSKNTSPPPPPDPVPRNFSLDGFTVDGLYNGFNYTDVKPQPLIKIKFGAKLKPGSFPNAIVFTNTDGAAIDYSITTEAGDSTILIRPKTALASITKFKLNITNLLESASGGKLLSGIDIQLMTPIDSTDKFPRISDDALLTLVEKQTFRYFSELAHPVSRMSRERKTSGDIVTTGGTGFGVMAILVAIHRGFISRKEGLDQVQIIADFLINKASRFHGAFPHWLNGSTGQVIPFSTKDDGADLVETSFLLQGLLCARQYFSGNDSAEKNLRIAINEIWNAVEWNWFTKNNEPVLYWHWSIKYNWEMNFTIRGWNESLITYVLAAASTTYTIPKAVYDQGWASNGSFKNGNKYFGYTLPLGPVMGGPLFFSHYSFLGINPNGLTDQYADYALQNTNHSLINYSYCVANPKSMYGYSDRCWGLTASDIKNGYAASSPVNDLGFIAPTAALSSFPYTSVESMKALHFFYYKLGDKIWKDYGFTDAFSLKETWFSEDFLAIDQGPIIVMIENYRSGLLWNLFTGCPEIIAGMKKLGFSAAYL